jgi:hypothetical protein
MHYRYRTYAVVTLSAVRGGLLAAGGPDGIVLTSSVTRSSRESPRT